MGDPWEQATIAAWFAEHARTSSRRAPLHGALSAAIARDPSLASILAVAPPGQRLSVLLLAVVHLSVRAEPDHPLAAWYPTIVDDPRDPDDPALAPTLRAFVDERLPEITRLVGERHVQTNEVGRCALLLPSLAAAHAETGRPLARLDLGASAGLTLLADRFGYDYSTEAGEHAVGDGPLRLPCGVRGRPGDPLPDRIPPIPRRLGVDPRPVDVLDADAVAWLLACCWPDEIDRFRRLEAAIDLAAAAPPRVVAGDAADVGSHLAGLLDGDDRLHPVVTTTWVVCYLSADERRSLLDRLDRIGAARDLDWVFAESPRQTPELPHPAPLVGHDVTSLVRVRWRDGHRTVHTVARCHPHGRWMHEVDA